MNTFQDLQAIGADERKRMDFVLSVIADHKSSSAYSNAVVAEAYYSGLNVTISNYQKFIRDAYGKLIADIWSPNHKISCRYYGYLVTYLALFLVGNGVSFGKNSTKEKLGGSDFDETITNLLISALNAGAAFAFVNGDRIVPFKLTEFAPLPDEETSSIRAGVRFWQLDGNKPLRATLYEEDGYTDYIRRTGEDMAVLREKRPYIQVVASSVASGEEIVDGQNYPAFPVVPLYNYGKRSELDGNRELHDAMDLMLSGLVNNVDSGEVIYWLFKNAGGMDQPSLNQAIQLLKTAHVLQVDNEDDVTPHSPEIHFEASKEAIEQLRRQIFDNHMGLDVRGIASGAATATQIKAAYEPLNTKADLIEMQLVKFIRGVLDVLGIEDRPAFTRSMIVNQQEMIQTIVSTGADLPQEYKTRKILEILGDIDRADDVLAQLTAEDANRFVTEPEEAEE